MVKSLEIKKLKEKLKELMGDPKPTGRPRFRKFDTPAPKMQPRPRDPSTPAPKMQPRPRPMPGGLKPLTPAQRCLLDVNLVNLAILYKRCLLRS